MQETPEELTPVEQLRMIVREDGTTDFPTKKALFEQQQALARWTVVATDAINNIYDATASIISNKQTPGTSEVEEQEVEELVEEPKEETDIEEELTHYRKMGDGSRLWLKDGYTIRLDQVPPHILQAATEREVE